MSDRSNDAETLSARQYSDSFNEHADSLREARKQDDFDNLQHSLSGVETGQQARHGLSKDTPARIW